MSRPAERKRSKAAELCVRSGDSENESFMIDLTRAEFRPVEVEPDEDVYPNNVRFSVGSLGKKRERRSCRVSSLREMLREAEILEIGGSNYPPVNGIVMFDSRYPEAGG